MPYTHSTWRLGCVAVTCMVAVLLAPCHTQAQAVPDPATGQQPADAKLTAPQLESLVGRIALYPDSLIANILPASTVPLDVVSAARYLRKSDDKVEKAPEGSNWDVSVQALLTVPKVLHMMDDDLDWTRELGDAVIAQQEDVMNAIQSIRRKAYDAGNLKSTEQQIIVVEAEVIVVKPAEPTVVYVPSYNPQVIIVKQEQPDAKPLIAFGAGVIVGVLLADDDCDWHHHHFYHGHYSGHVDIDINRNVNVNRPGTARPADPRGRRDPRGIADPRGRRDPRGLADPRGPVDPRGVEPWKPSARAQSDYQARKGGSASAPSRARSGFSVGGSGAGSVGSTPNRATSDRGYPSSSRTGSRQSTQQRSGTGQFGEYERGSSSRRASDRGQASRGGRSTGTSGGRSSGSRGGGSRGGRR